MSLASPSADGLAVPTAHAELADPRVLGENAAYAKIVEDAEAHRLAGADVVVVQGLGFVGAAVAAVIAGANDTEGRPCHFVVGVDLPTTAGSEKVARLQAGVSPIGSADAELETLTRRVVERGTLTATTSERAYELADVIVVDIPLDVADRLAGSAAELEVVLPAFEGAVRAIGRRMREDALVIVETTVPPGTCEQVVLPILNAERRERSIDRPVLLAHAYERVMPGARYVESIRSYPRTFSGIDEASAARAREFLSSFIDVEAHPLWELPDTTSSEIAKLLENAYRSMNIAFIQEWTLLAETTGVDLYEIIESIRVRKGTHDNIRYPGFGVGGYCLPKDSLLAQWGATNLAGSNAVLDMTLAAVRTNALMPLHTRDLVAELMGDLQGRTVAVCGVSYLPGVPDTRNSPTEVLVDALVDAGADVRVHDPQIEVWPERPDATLSGDLTAALAGADGVIFTVRHPEYVGISAAELLELAGGALNVVDAQNVVSDAKAALLVESGCRIAGVGKGHWRKRGYGA